MAEEKNGKTKKHLHSIRSEETEDGHIIHHHTYKKKRGDQETEPERRNVAVSASPEEAGQHVEEQFGMNQTPPASAAPQGAPEPEEEAAPAAPQEEMS